MPQVRNRRFSLCFVAYQSCLRTFLRIWLTGPEMTHKSEQNSLVIKNWISQLFSIPTLPTNYYIHYQLLYSFNNRFMSHTYCDECRFGYRNYWGLSTDSLYFKKVISTKVNNPNWISQLLSSIYRFSIPTIIFIH